MIFKHCVRASQRRMRRRARRRRTGIKGMQIGKNESCSLLFLLFCLPRSIGDRGSGKEVADAIWKEKCPFEGIYSSKHHHHYCGWWVGVPHHRRSSSAGLVFPKILFCVSNVVTLSLAFPVHFLCPSKLILINTRGLSSENNSKSLILQHVMKTQMRLFCNF